jgi:ABC-2 type transport system permease protein
MTIDTTARYSPAAATLWRILGVARRHAYVMQRSPHRTFDVLVWPVVDVLLFGSIGVFASSRATNGAAQFALYLLVGVILWHVVYQAQIAVATGFLEETWSRSVLNLLVTPMREWEYVLGVALFGLVKLVVAVGGVTLIVWAAFAFQIRSIGPGMIPVAALLLVVGWSIALFVIGLVLRFGAGAEAFAWGILFVIMPLSGAFYPVEALPVVVRPVAHLLPTTYAFASGRAVAAGEPMPWGQFAIGVLGAAVVAAIGLGYVTWMLRVFRRRGYVNRYS